MSGLRKYILDEQSSEDPESLVIFPVFKACALSVTEPHFQVVLADVLKSLEN